MNRSDDFPDMLPRLRDKGSRFVSTVRYIDKVYPGWAENNGYKLVSEEQHTRQQQHTRRQLRQGESGESGERT